MLARHAGAERLAALHPRPALTMGDLMRSSAALRMSRFPPASSQFGNELFSAPRAVGDFVHPPRPFTSPDHALDARYSVGSNSFSHLRPETPEQPIEQDLRRVQSLGLRRILAAQLDRIGGKGDRLGHDRHAGAGPEAPVSAPGHPPPSLFSVSTSVITGSSEVRCASAG